MAGIDNPCEQCGAAKCAKEAEQCAASSTCDEKGEPEGGCLALVQCAAVKCGGGDDVQCVLSMCGDELASAGGVSGAGTAAAQALGACIGTSCANECLSMGTGGSGGGG
jgi:hypothetical protein